MAKITENGSEISIEFNQGAIGEGRIVELDERITATVDSDGRLLALHIDDISRPLSGARRRPVSGLNLYAEPSEPDWPGIG